MSKAEQRALEAYPVKSVPYYGLTVNAVTNMDANEKNRSVFQFGYEQAEKDLIERAIAWLKEHANDYIVDLTPTYPDAPVNIIVGGKCWDDLKEYLEEEK